MQKKLARKCEFKISSNNMCHVQKKTYVFDSDMKKLLATCYPVAMQEKEKGQICVP